MASSADHREQSTLAAGLVGSPGGWGWAAASGVLLIVAGLFALAAPVATSQAFAIFVGWLLLIAGVGGIVMGVRTRIAHRRTIDFLYGLVSLALGAVLLVDPLAGALTLTLAFAFWLAFRGAIELGGARRTTPGGLRNALIVTGVVNLLLALLLLFYFPWPSVAVVGLFIGISFLVGGVVTLIAAWQLRRLAAG